MPQGKRREKCLKTGKNPTHRREHKKGDRIPRTREDLSGMEQLDKEGIEDCWEVMGHLEMTVYFLDTSSPTIAIESAINRIPKPANNSIEPGWIIPCIKTFKPNIAEIALKM